MSDGSHPLELSPDEFRQRLAEVGEELARFLESLPRQPASQLADGDSLARGAVEPLPERGVEFSELLRRLFTEVFPTALNTTAPGYLAYIPGGGLPQAALADLMALVTNRYAGLWSVAPVAATIEATVIRWFCDLIGFPATASGFLTSGGSLSNWSAMVLAREERASGRVDRGTVYTSSQSHHSVAKAAFLAGISRHHVRLVPVDAEFRIGIDELAAAVRRDRAAGLTPLAIVANAGTTNSGAVDDLGTLAQLAADEGIWLHTDAAYGGFFALTDRGRRTLAGIECADSVTLDPHKGLFLPYGTGCLLVRDRQKLRSVFAGRGEYLQDTVSADDFVDFCDLSPELSREFRGLRVWLPMQMHGADAFRQCLDEKLDLAEWIVAELRSIEGLEIVAVSPLTIVAFRLRHDRWSSADFDRFNRRFLERINASQRVWLTSTVLQGRLTIRICVLSFRTHRDRMEECATILRVAARETLAEAGSG